MTRFVTKAAILAVAALPMLAPVAAAQTAQAVDEKTGPVSFANVASVRLGSDPQHSGSLITETQRSPLTPGQSKLSAARVAVPANESESKTFGGHWEIDLGKFDNAASSPYPKGIESRDHNVVAALQATDVPTAVAETNYALRDNARGNNAADDTMLVLEGAHSSVECASPGKVTSSTTVTRLWVRGEDNTLRQVEMPAGAAQLRVENLRMGAPGDVANADPSKSVSDLVVSRVNSFDQLIKQSGWRSGDVTTQAGWLVDVTTHLRDTAGTQLPDVKTSIVLGGVSCSIPKNFVAKSGNGSGNGGAPATQPAVPTEVPAGYVGPQAVAPQSDYRMPLGLSLLVAGLVFGGLAIGLGRRRTARGK
ncbi:MAG TPA: hypothetical protein VG674_26200 [Amycolatopsis sp.]|jgi:hypothetical protein|nr:hypothetical protein [Amycolatopsis sp.]